MALKRYIPNSLKILSIFNTEIDAVQLPAKDTAIDLERIQVLDIKEKEALLCSKYDNINRLLAIYNVHRQDREDLLHNIFVNALRALERLRDAEKMDSWLWKITRNEINRYWRGVIKKREMVSSIDAEDFNLQLVYGADASSHKLEGEIERLANREELVEALHKLSEKTLILFRLYYFEGYKLREIAQITGDSESAVKSRHQRGLVKLKSILEEMKEEEDS